MEIPQKRLIEGTVTHQFEAVKRAEMVVKMTKFDSDSRQELQVAKQGNKHKLLLFKDLEKLASNLL